jgi:membrane-associated HD superfamily phosphohydrolase
MRALMIALTIQILLMSSYAFWLPTTRTEIVIRFAISFFLLPLLLEWFSKKQFVFQVLIVMWGPLLLFAFIEYLTDRVLGLGIFPYLERYRLPWSEKGVLFSCLCLQTLYLITYIQTLFRRRNGDMEDSS